MLALLLSTIKHVDEAPQLWQHKATIQLIFPFDGLVMSYNSVTLTPWQSDC
jgi:hypothetical protein